MASGVYQFSGEFQAKLLALLWREPKAYATYKSAVKPAYFESEVDIDLCRLIFDYEEQYHKSPTQTALIEEVGRLCHTTRSKGKNIKLYLDRVQYLSTVEVPEAEYIRDRVVEFGKHQALSQVVVNATDILLKNQTGKYQQLESDMRQALSVGEDTSDLGVGIFDNVRERFVGYIQAPDVIERIPTGMKALDKVLGGGVGRSEMCVIIAPPGRGKTTTLISMSANAVLSGYNVLHISLENNESQILRNYDVRILGHTLDELKDNVEGSIEAMNIIHEQVKGDLRVKKYPTKTATVSTIRNLVDQLILVDDWHPDVITVDYGAILASEHDYKDKRSGIEEVYESLRALADEYDVALYTAAQGNRSSLAKKVVTTMDLAECFAIANIADICVALCQDGREKAQGIMRGFVAKNRDNSDGMILTGTINYNIKRLDFTDEVSDAEQYNIDDSSDDDWE